MIKMGSLPGDSGCWMSDGQPYHHNPTGNLKKGSELMELFSQLFAPLNHPLPFSFARCSSPKPSTSGFAVTFQLQLTLGIGTRGLRW